MRRGEIRWYEFQKPDKRSPVVILKRNSALEYLHEVTIAPITTTIREIPTEVVLSTSDGMKNDCAIKLDHIQTVSKYKIGSVIATLAPEKKRQVKSALLFALGFDIVP